MFSTKNVSLDISDHRFYYNESLMRFSKPESKVHLTLISSLVLEKIACLEMLMFSAKSASAEELRPLLKNLHLPFFH